MEYVELNNGIKMPKAGFGVYQIGKDECEECVLNAIKVGYRLIDTAQSYFNEEEVGNAIEKAIQTIEFELDREGGKVKSEAGIMMNLSDSLELEKREFYIDDTFAIFLIEEDKDTPYFAAKINDITKFQ